jgi:hypothetical protein
METVVHHVTRSGASTLRGFFASDAVDFDPPSLSLRQNITKAKAKVVYDLASGFTPASEERDIRDLMKSSENSYELIRMIGAIDGWDGLDSELEYGQVDQVATQLAQVLDQRDYVIYHLVRRYLILLDYGASPNFGDCFLRLLRWPIEFQAPEIDLLLSRKADLLKGVTSATMRGRTNMVSAAQVLPVVIQQVMAAAPHRSVELIALIHETNYTTRICSSLAQLDYQPLYRVIADMVDPALTNLQRIACKDTCQRLRLEFAAAAKAVEVVGSNQAKSTVDRFMAALKAALDNFAPALPAPNAVSAILAALGGVGTTLNDLLTAVTNLPDALAGAISLPALLGSSDDDNARQLVSELQSQGSLARIAFTIKVQMINAALDGFTGDDDEIAINSVMQAAKDYDQAELYQLAAAATWDALYSSIDGEEYDALLSILQQPT